MNKSNHRALFLAMQADAKDFPGGIRGIAEIMGRNCSTLANQLNPDHEAAPPSLDVLVELIKLSQAKRTVFVFAQMVNQVPMDFQLDHTSQAEAVNLFLTMMHKVGDLLGKGSEAAKDGRFDAGERKMLEPLLLGLMKACGELLQAVRD